MTSLTVKDNVGSTSIGRGRGRINTGQSTSVVGGASEVSAPPPPAGDAVPQDTEDGSNKITE